MKKIISLLLVALMVVGMFAGCSVGKDEKNPTNAPTQIPTTIPDVSGNVTEPSDEVVDPTEDTNEPSLALTATETVLNSIIEKQPMQFPTMVMPLDLTDVFAIEAYTGLKSADGIVEGAFCEAMMGSQAFSLVLVKVADPANAEAVAKAMQEGINPRKWICVEADDLMVVATGDLVLLAMMDSEYSADATAKSTTDLFAQECGELSVTLTGKPE